MARCRPAYRLKLLSGHVLLPGPVAAVGAGGDTAELADIAAVRKVMDDYTTAVWSADGPLLKSLYHPGAIFNGSLGKKSIFTAPQAQVDDLTKMAAKGESFKSKGVPRSFRVVSSISIYGNIATTVTQEDGSKISPEKPFTCIDAFHLIKIDGVWKIIAQFFSFGAKLGMLPDIVAVEGVMQKYTEGTWIADEVLLRSIFHEKAIMNGYNNKSTMLGSAEPFFKYLATLSSKGKSFKTKGFDYQGETVSVCVYGQAATAVVQEKGFNGNTAYTDAFQLIKEGGEWKIVSKLFTGSS